MRTAGCGLTRAREPPGPWKQPFQARPARSYGSPRPSLGWCCFGRHGERKCILEGRGTRQMDFRQEIARQVEKLPPDMQEQVLRFAASLSASAPVGEKGARLRQFSSSLDSVSARQMSQAIEEECEQVDAGEW